MVPLNRNLRPRVRRLPIPPNSTVVSSPKIILQPEEEVKPKEQKAKTFPITEKKLEEKINSLMENKFNSNINDTKKNVLSELDEVIKHGIETSLVKPEINNKKEHIDYAKIKQMQYERAVGDYEEAGKTLADSGLYSNASISFGCAVLAKYLSSNSIPATYDEFQNIVEKIQDKQIIRSSFLSILTQLFEAVANKDKGGIERNIEKLKMIELFSSDDQELLANFISQLSKKNF